MSNTWQGAERDGAQQMVEEHWGQGEGGLIGAECIYIKSLASASMRFFKLQYRDK